MSFWRYLTPLQQLGALGLLGLTAFYIVTYALTGVGQVNPVLISGFTGLIGLPEARKAFSDAAQPPPLPPSPDEDEAPS